MRLWDRSMYSILTAFEMNESILEIQLLGYSSFCIFAGDLKLGKDFRGVYFEKYWLITV